MDKEVEVKPLTGEGELLETVTVKDATIESQRLATGKTDLVAEVKDLNAEMVRNTQRITDALSPDKSVEKEAVKTNEKKVEPEAKESEKETEEDLEK